MRIAFDGTTLRPARTGVGWYAERLLRHLAAAGTDDEFVVISNRRAEVGFPLPANVRVHDRPRTPVSLAWLQIAAPAIVRSLGAEVAHFTNGVMPAFGGVPSVVTIHDMSLTLYPRYHPVRRVLLHRPLVDLAARRAAAIITHSVSAKRDIVRLYRIDPARVHAVHLAAPPEFTRVVDPAALDDVRRRYNLPESFILYVGTIEPRKNLARLLDAFADRRRAGALRLPLICAGPYGWREKEIRPRVAALGVDRAVRFIGYVPLADLPALYTLCDLFVYPSLYEGFGLPVVEAMACGTPVLAGRNPAVMEVGGDAVTFVDPLDTAALGDTLVNLIEDAARRRDLGALGTARARTFSWERAAAETLAVYRTALPAVSRARAAPAAVRSAAPGPVLFGQGYFLRFDPKPHAARQPYAPLGTLYAAGYLRERGHRVAVFDSMLAGSEAEWAQALDRERPPVVVIYEDSFNYLSKMCLLRMRGAALRMIEEARRRRIPALVAGSDATDHPEVYLEAGATAVVLREGEATLHELVSLLTRPGAAPLDEVRGICFRARDGRTVRTPPREFIAEIDALPRPAWDLVDVPRYRQIWRRHHGYHSMNLVTTRGCPYHCNWCAKPIYGQRYAVRSVESVVDEMAWLKDTYAPDHLWIADDIFALRPGWLRRFAALVVERGAVIPFKCLMRADQLGGDAAALLRQSGCRSVWIGAESGSQRILDAMDKGVRVEAIVAAARALHAAGIEVGLFLQFGYPGEMRDDIEQTLRMVRACRPDDIGVSISYPLPGTRFYERVRAELGQKRNWVDSDDLEPMYHATYSPEFYRTLHRAVHAEFRLRRSASVGRLWRAPWRVRPRHLRLAASSVANGVRLPLLRWQLGQVSRGPISPPVQSAERGADA